MHPPERSTDAVAWSADDVARSADGVAQSAGLHEQKVSFDRIARAYRWLELLTFGTALQHCRTRLLPDLAPIRNALVLGDGDGRALHALALQHPQLSVTALDLSPAMLEQLRRRCAPLTRLTTVVGDARDVLRALPSGTCFDLVTTHFVLDCFDGSSLDTLVRSVTGHTTPGAQWLVSEFRIAPGWRGVPARCIVYLLYVAFGVLTGLRVRTLPDHALALSKAGWKRLRAAHSAGGLLTAELWQRVPSRSPAL